MSKVKKFFEAIHAMLTGLYNALFGFVLHSFKSINRKVRSRLPVWRMKEETLEHVRFLIKMFKLVVLPCSILYVFAVFYLFGENAVGPMLWSLLIFFYSNFLPDLPSIYRKKNKEEAKDLPWYKKYTLLLFAPLLIWFLFSGIQPKWETMETFHNFKSLTIYGVFLLILGFFAFARFPISMGNVSEILLLPLYGMLGYLAHLKVDKVW